jgi:transcription elongation GreA/GreB family factor
MGNSIKQALLDQGIQKLEEELRGILAAAQAAHQAATHEESKAEDQYDTRGLEASYLAAAQTVRATELGDSIRNLKAIEVREFTANEVIAPGALVDVESAGRKSRFFLLSHGGGLSLQGQGLVTLILTPSSPLGEGLLGKRVNDVIEIELKTGFKEYRVVAIS